ncbi:MAG: hypothetical protein R3A43_01765 [Bacteroidia bacterium]
MIKKLKIALGIFLFIPICTSAQHTFRVNSVAGQQIIWVNGGAYLKVVGHLTEPLSYKISSYRIENVGYLSNKNESYRIKLKFK